MTPPRPYHNGRIRITVVSFPQSAGEAARSAVSSAVLSVLRVLGDAGAAGESLKRPGMLGSEAENCSGVVSL